jgi:hypothetical protein
MIQVTHPTLGTGTIINQDENNVTVDFNGTVKTLVIKYAKLTNEDGTAFGVQAVAKEKKARKVNKANGRITAEEWAKSKYSTMSKDDFADERAMDAYKSVF